MHTQQRTPHSHVARAVTFAFGAAVVFGFAARAQALEGRTGSSSVGAARSHVDGATHGLYPIWESVGYVIEHQRIVIGIRDASYGILDVAAVGVQPMPLIFRVPNFTTRFAVHRQDEFGIAVDASIFAILPGASRSFFSSTYTSRFQNADFLVLAVPISAVATWRALPWMNLHSTTTMLSIVGGDQVRETATFGEFVTVELLGHRNHSVFLHAGEAGFWNHEFGMLGVSYRFSLEWLEARLGYFFQFRDEGVLSQPLFTVGFLL